MAGTKGKSGGARKGAGRKATGPQKVRVMFYLRPDTLAFLDGRRGIHNRSQYVEMLIFDGRF